MVDVMKIYDACRAEMNASGWDGRLWMSKEKECPTFPNGILALKVNYMGGNFKAEIVLDLIPPNHTEHVGVECGRNLLRMIQRGPG